MLSDVELEIQSSEIVILTGPSGSGKTTLLTLIGALRAVQEGSVEVLDCQLSGATRAMQLEVRRKIGFVFQRQNLLESLTARENVQMVASLSGGDRARRGREISLEMLVMVGLRDLADHRPSRLSGGERQRVAIARALAGQPRILLADEPTASLDGKSGRHAVELMEKLARDRDVAVLLVTHDARVLDVADRVLQLEDGDLLPAGQTSLTTV